METNGDSRAVAGGKGAATVLQDLERPGTRKSTAAMLERAVKACSLVSEDLEFWRPIVKALQEGATKVADDPRGAARCASVLATLRAQNADILKHLDKNERLDNDEPTENIAHKVYSATFDRQG